MQTAPRSTRSTLKSAVGRVDSEVLFARWQAQGDHAARAELIRRFTPLARKLARRYTGAHEPFDDLLQVATVGLVKAVDGFDRTRGSAFSSYAVPTIVGERYFRDLGWSVHVPRGAQEMALRVENAQQELVGRLGRGPTVNELAEYLELSMEEVVDAREAAQAITPSPWTPRARTPTATPARLPISSVPRTGASSSSRRASRSPAPRATSHPASAGCSSCASPETSPRLRSRPRSASPRC